ncbi:hypothetical protein QCA50_003731 [Cerrena zonata]|uniref:Aminoglycoside phosphotransferase domain-containing protein n=1 Tax=Cerrena zonata TaxID=2478898 RepID=A0AAW0GQA3_9APHY
MGAVCSSYMLDLLHSSTVSKQMPIEAEQSISAAHDELLELGRTSPAVPIMKRCQRTVCRVFTDTITKSLVSPPEVATFELVETTTTIPTPIVRRFILEPASGGHLWREVVIIWTLRGYIRRLRKIPLPRTDQGPRPGPLGDKPLVDEGCLFGDYSAGPFSTYSELTDWYAHKLEVAQRLNKAPSNARPFDNSRPLVLTHTDLTPYNIMLDDTTCPFVSVNESSITLLWERR